MTRLEFFRHGDPKEIGEYLCELYQDSVDEAVTKYNRSPGHNEIADVSPCDGCPAKDFCGEEFEFDRMAFWRWLTEEVEG